MSSFEKDILKLKVMNDDTEFIPLLSSEDEQNMENESMPDVLPILPLRNNVLFPGVVIPITVGRDKSIKLIKEAYDSNKTIGVLSQFNSDIEDPEIDDLYQLGSVARILKMLKMPDGSTTAIIQGKRKFRVKEFTQTEPYFKASVDPVPNTIPDPTNPKISALMDSMKEMSLQIIQNSPNIPSEASFAIKNIESNSFLVSFIASNMNASAQQKQELLAESDFEKRAEKLLLMMNQELQMLEMKNEIQNKVKSDLDRQQREYFLHQQMKTIQDELGDNGTQTQINEMRERAEKKKWSKKIKEAFLKELGKLERMNPAGAEYTVQLNYVELLIDLPWQSYSKDKFDLKRAKKILDRDHYGLEKVKERIIEYLAVLKLKQDMKAPILCLYGPPGVGKTSLGKSIAEAVGRKYVRMSLGGVRDEAEIRGHRRTYIGAMPGRVLSNLKKAGTSNPVFVLDEIDKLTRDNHGDPSSALLEVLDPEQNFAFNDNFVELDYDLSKVMFVATANSLATIPGPLRDRMEIITVNGYTVEEKVEIANNHLIPKQLKENGVTKKQITIPNTVIEKLIESYTSESGVRKLEQRIGKLVRFRAKQIALEEKHKTKISPDQLVEILGPSYTKDKYEGNDIPGVVTGLAWTRVGGDVLFIETSVTKGKGKLSLTGNLGKVMKESATLALEYLKAHSDMLDIKPEVFDKLDIHIHIPEGATPKDGPSAGVTMLTALASILTGRKVKKSLAMTGEITLRGKVLPVGGIKEKILAAKRADIKEIVLCKSNKKDIDDIQPKYLTGLKFHYVDKMIEVLDIALLKSKAKSAFDVGSVLK
jgi:ATP-dependent Lon protease